MLAAKSWKIRTGLERYVASFGTLIAVAIIIVPLVWMVLPADPHRRKMPRHRQTNPAVQSLVSLPEGVAMAKGGNAGR